MIVKIYVLSALCAYMSAFRLAEKTEWGADIDDIIKSMVLSLIPFVNYVFIWWTIKECKRRQ